MRTPDPVAGNLARVIKSALEERAEMLAAGGDPTAVAKGFEQVVREVWPKGREEPWHDLCSTCGDYGFVLSQCSGDASCGRKAGHAPHEYGSACWCQAGKAFRPKSQRPAEDALAAVGKTAKPSRFGR